MNYLTSSDYLALTGVSSAGVNIDYLDFLLATYSAQINKITCTQFNASVGTRSKTIKIQQCGTDQVRFSAYLKQGFTVSLRRTPSSALEPLVENVDYTIIEPDDYTYVDCELVDSPIIGLDFGCLSCFCSCQSIVVSGTPAWSDGLPDDIKGMLVSAVNLAMSSQAPAVSGSNSTSTATQVVLERDITTTTQWSASEDLNGYYSRIAVADLPGIAGFMEVLLRYKYYNVPPVFVL